MSYSTSVVASRCTVLFASPRRAASALMPISYSCSEKALVRRSALATDESRMRRGLGFFTRSMARLPGEPERDGVGQRDGEEDSDAEATCPTRPCARRARAAARRAAASAAMASARVAIAKLMTREAAAARASADRTRWLTQRPLRESVAIMPAVKMRPSARRRAQPARCEPVSEKSTAWLIVSKESANAAPTAAMSTGCSARVRRSKARLRSPAGRTTSPRGVRITTARVGDAQQREEGDRDPGSGALEPMRGAPADGHGGHRRSPPA